MQKLYRLKNKKGFTLVEMLIVILIIVILLAIAVPSILAYREETQEAADLGAAKNVYSAIEAALSLDEFDYNATGSYPFTHSATSDEIYLTTQMKPGHDYVRKSHVAPSYPVLTLSAELLGEKKFGGYYKFGYDLGTESVIWVTYHDGLGADSADAADPSETMLYHVRDNVSGYLNDPSLTAYNTTVYQHN